VADYLELDSNPTKDKYLAGMQRLFNVYGETEVLFSEYGMKVDRRGKEQRRAIVVTGKTIYKQDPNNYKVKKGELPISEITDICMSPNKVRNVNNTRVYWRFQWQLCSRRSEIVCYRVAIGISNTISFSSYCNILTF
jgi:hypothetical protein